MRVQACRFLARECQGVREKTAGGEGRWQCCYLGHRFQASLMPPPLVSTQGALGRCRLCRE